MTLPRLTLPDDAYNLAWKNRKPGETIPEVITWALHFAFDPELKPVVRVPLPRHRVPVRPLLEWVTVIDSGAAS